MCFLCNLSSILLNSILNNFIIHGANILFLSESKYIMASSTDSKLFKN